MKGNGYITIGDIRIKKSSFRNCIIINDSDNIVKSVVELGEKRRELIKCNEELIESGETFIVEIEKNKQEIEQCGQKMNVHMLDSDNYWIALTNTLRCLVITTYENGEYKFYQDACGFDILKKMGELRPYKRPLVKFYFCILRKINKLMHSQF